MAVTQINLSDPVTTLVTKTNTIASDLGDKALLSTTDKTNLVAAINEINTQVGKVDSADVINLITANALDSSEVIQLLADTTADANIYSNFQKDSANGIGFDSSQGRFFIPPNTINASMIELNAVTEVKIENNSITEAKMADDAISSVELKSLSTLLIKDSAGSTLKTIHGAGV
tara:strand:+ start:1800 stop:2321 length:522 start_codon:yes stop_codon:yes gene_type:complete